MLPLLAAYMAAGAAGSLGSGHGLSQTPIIGGLFGDPAQQEFEDKLRENSIAWQARMPVLQQQAKGLMGMIDQAYSPARAAMAQLYNGTTTQPAPPPPQGAPAAVAPPVQAPPVQLAPPNDKYQGRGLDPALRAGYTGRGPGGY